MASVEQLAFEVRWLKKLKDHASRRIPMELSEVYQQKIKALIYGIEHWDISRRASNRFYKHMQLAIRKGRIDQPDMICNAIADRLMAGSFYDRMERLLDVVGLSWVHAHYGKWDVDGYREICQGPLVLVSTDPLLNNNNNDISSTSRKRVAPAAASTDTTTAKRRRRPTREPMTTIDNAESVTLDGIGTGAVALSTPQAAPAPAPAPAPELQPLAETAGSAAMSQNNARGSDSLSQAPAADVSRDALGYESDGVPVWAPHRHGFVEESHERLPALGDGSSREDSDANTLSQDQLAPESAAGVVDTDNNDDALLQVQLPVAQASGLVGDQNNSSPEGRARDSSYMIQGDVQVTTPRTHTSQIKQEEAAYVNLEATHPGEQSAQHQGPPSYEELLEALREQTEVLRKAQAMLQQTRQFPAHVKEETPRPTPTPAGQCGSIHTGTPLKTEEEREAVSVVGEPRPQSRASPIFIDLGD